MGIELGYPIVIEVDDVGASNMADNQAYYKSEKQACGH